MTITGGFGILFANGTARRWYLDPDGVKRFEDTGEPVEMEKDDERG